MRILHTEASLGWGGQEIRTLRESIGMRDRGHNIIIAAHPGSGLFSRAEKEGFETIPVDFKRRNFFRIILFFRKLIEGKKVDIVNTHSSKDSWLVLPAARIANNKPLTLRTRHLSTPIGKDPATRFLYNSLPHFIITTGKAIKDQMVMINRFDPDKILSIPTGVDAGAFDPGIKHFDIREELGLKPSTPLVGTVSVIRSWKGLDYLVKAVPLVLRQIPDARFVIAGDGIHKKTLELTIKETGTGDKVYLLGHRKDVVNVLHSIDILVHPSFANEGVPQVVLQAMAMKKPVIASDLAPLREIVIEDKTGVLTRLKSPDDIANSIVRLLHDKEMSKRLGENGRELVLSSYLFTGMLDKLEILYGKAKNEHSLHGDP